MIHIGQGRSMDQRQRHRPPLRHPASPWLPINLGLICARSGLDPEPAARGHQLARSPG